MKRREIKHLSNDKGLLMLTSQQGSCKDRLDQQGIWKIWDTNKSSQEPQLK